ncbi:MAG: ATP-binding protein, partial [Kofleriaceae bacterium]
MDRWFPGGSELARRMRALDWSATPLGPPERWPEALRAAVSLCLSVRFPLFVCWGAERVLIYNEAARALLDPRDPRRGPGRPARELWRGAWDALGPLLDAVYATGEPAELDELAIPRSDPSAATDHYLRLSIAPLFAGGPDVAGALVSCTELTAQVRAAHRLAQERASIVELIELTPVPIAILRGRELVFEAANPSYLEMIGREVRGRPALEVLPELRDGGWAEAVHEVMRTGIPYVRRDLRAIFERAGRHEPSYWTIIFVPLRALDRQIERIVVVTIDVTEQVTARAQLEQLAIRADAANRTKDEFLAILGHELRNPLAPIVTALQLMRMHGAQSREQDIIERQVSHLTRLVDDLLDVSRITRGKIELREEPIELADVVARAVEITSPLFEQRRHVLDVHVPGGLGISADVDRMAQVFANLLSNAAKYSEPGSRITVDAQRVDDRVRARVVDEGMGIEPDMLAHVFDPFVQQAQTIDRARGGLGLGLAIVKSLVELHGGAVEVRSEGRGRGSEFTIELPALPGGELARSPAPGIARMASERPKRILVVDDNDDAAAMLKEVLEDLGYQVEVAHDGPSALATAQRFEPDIGLLDIGLPV